MHILYVMAMAFKHDRAIIVRRTIATLRIDLQIKERCENSTWKLHNAGSGWCRGRIFLSPFNCEKKVQNDTQRRREWADGWMHTAYFSERNVLKLQ